MTVMQFLLLYDCSNVGDGVERASLIMNTLRGESIEVKVIIVVGKEPSLSKLKNYFSTIAETMSIRETGMKQSGDVMLAEMSGFILSEVTKGNRRLEGIVVASNDKSLMYCAKHWAELGKSAFVLVANPDKYSGTPKGVTLISYKPISSAVGGTKTAMEFSPESYPYIFESIDTIMCDHDYLEVEKVPVKNEPLPRIIPIPLKMDEISIGGGQAADIKLDYWDNLERKTIYPINAFLRSKGIGWEIMSAKGFRRGRGSVVVEGKIIDSATGYIILHNGVNFKIGGFEFKIFYKDRLVLDPKGNRKTLDDICNFIELTIARYIQVSFSEADKSWWPNLIPKKIRLKAEKRKGTEEDPFRFLDFSDLVKLVLLNWESIHFPFIFQLWHSKDQAKIGMGKIVQIRNKLKHPLRKAPTLDEEEYLKRVYYAIRPANE